MKYFLILFANLAFLNICAQNGNNEIGAPAAGMGYAYASINDRWALFHNPGGLGRVEETVALATFENRFGIAGLNALGAGFISRVPFGTVGVSAFRFGDDIYNEQIISANFANTYGIASLGVRANYIQYTIEGQGTQGLLAFDVGGTAKLTELIQVGAYIRNIGQAQISEINDQRIPTLLYAGMALKPTDKLLFTIETEKDLDEDARFKAGLQYQFLEKFTARTGIRTNNFTNFFGLSFISQKLGIDYASTWQNTLGLNHQLSVSYTLK